MKEPCPKAPAMPESQNVHRPITRRCEEYAGRLSPTVWLGYRPETSTSVARETASIPNFSVEDPTNLSLTRWLGAVLMPRSRDQHEIRRWSPRTSPRGAAAGGAGQCRDLHQWMKAWYETRYGTVRMGSAGSHGWGKRRKEVLGSVVLAIVNPRDIFPILALIGFSSIDIVEKEESKSWVFITIPCVPLLNSCVSSLTFLCLPGPNRPIDYNVGSEKQKRTTRRGKKYKKWVNISTQPGSFPILHQSNVFPKKPGFSASISDTHVGHWLYLRCSASMRVFM